MGPETSPTLYEVTVGLGAIEERIGEEMERRTVLAGMLAELSDYFAQGDAATHPVTEPTLPRNLFALAAVQNTHLGVAGSNPLEAISFSRSGGMVVAKAAPIHDSYTAETTDQTVSTRAIMMSIANGYQDSTAVEFFGLNMFTPDITTPDFVDAPEPSPASGLIIVGVTGERKTVQSHISGETPIVAVRNRETGDAKVYAISNATDEQVELLVAQEKQRGHAGGFVLLEDTAVVRLSDGQVQAVTVLRGEIRTEVAEEFRKAVEVIKGEGEQGLTLAERTMVADAVHRDTQK